MPGSLALKVDWRTKESGCRYGLQSCMLSCLAIYCYPCALTALSVWLPTATLMPSQEEIRKRIQAQDVNAAFEVALSTSDLQLVMFLCKEVNPEQLFDNEQCPLTQPVLLSLMQQLSVDLQDQLELKIRWSEGLGAWE